MNSTTAETAGMRPRLARTLTLSHAVLYGLGVTRGAGIYALVSVAAGQAALIRIETTETIPLPPGVFVCPFWVPVAGVIASAALLVIDVALIG